VPPELVTHRVLYNEEARKGLGILARAAVMSRAVALTGEPGSLKTTLCEHFAEITGRKIYKYQTHGGSEYGDLTITVNQKDDGTFEKQVRELYARLKEGNVVIDIDEANINPQILWVLESILRGKRQFIRYSPAKNRLK